MPFLSGPVTFVRFRPDRPRPRAFGDEHLTALGDRVIGRQRVASADGVETGWTAGGHVLDTDFQLSKNVFPDHLAWEFRVDTNAPPADLVKAYYQVELKALTRNNPSGFPSARQKREAKEAARERLEQEAKDGRFVKRKVVPCLWDATRNEVFFGATSATAQERFVRLFHQTFAADLRPVRAGELAVRLHPKAEDERLSPFVRGLTPEDGPAWQILADGPPDFLGNEFLLWLWYTSDDVGDTLQLPDGSEATFMFSGGVKVECPRGATGTGTLNSDSAPRLPEARTAVRYGKLPRKAALTVVRNGDQFSFVLQAETLAVTAGKVPKPPEDVTDARALAEHRLQLVRDLADALEQMYAAFLRTRLGAGWADELRGVQGWLARATRERAGRE